MKFLLELVSCYRAQQQQNSSSSDQEPAAPPVTTRSRSLRAEETRSLVRPRTPTMPQVVGRMMRRKIMRRSRSSRSVVGGGDWRPTLFVISEDTVVPPPEKKVVAEQKKKKVESKRCSASVRVRGHDNFGHDPYRIAVPAFAPTPFMF